MQTISHPIPLPPSLSEIIHLPRKGHEDPNQSRKSGAIFDLGVRECRYCLGGESKEGGGGEGGKDRLWEPCGCEGAVQLVHEGCFLEWL
jgi:hypothetical protein